MRLHKRLSSLKNIFVTIRGYDDLRDKNITTVIKCAISNHTPCILVSAFENPACLNTPDVNKRI